MLIIIIISALLLFLGYVEWANRNSRQMTYRQKMLKAVYPLWMWFSRTTGSNSSVLMHEGSEPPVSIYGLTAINNTGDTVLLEQYRGKKILIVNTASDCGYSQQFSELQNLYKQYGDRLEVLAFPSNDFKNQEKGSDESIAAFCRLNYSIGFPLMKKSVVRKKEGQHPVYRWLTDPSQNGWNKRQPIWNFSKYLINEQGALTHYFGPAVSPLGEQVQKAITIGN